MTTETSTTRFRIDGVRCDWPNLFKGEQFNGTGKFRCGTRLIVPKDHKQFSQIKAAIEQAAADKFKAKAQAVLKANRWPEPGPKDAICFKDSSLDTKAPEGYEGTFYLSANCQGGDTEAECTKPTVYDAQRNKIKDARDNPIYRGCYVNALVEFYADNRFGDGVFCKLVGIQFAKNGDAFGSAPARDDDFEPVEEGAGADDFV